MLRSTVVAVLLLASGATSWAGERIIHDCKQLSGDFIIPRISIDPEHYRMEIPTIEFVRERETRRSQNFGVYRLDEEKNWVTQQGKDRTVVLVDRVTGLVTVEMNLTGGEYVSHFRTVRCKRAIPAF